MATQQKSLSDVIQGSQNKQNPFFLDIGNIIKILNL